MFRSKGQTFLANESISEVISAATGNYWDILFDRAREIYSLEMLALMAKLYQHNRDMGRQKATSHIDNQNASESLVKNNATPTVIVEMTHLIWHRLQALNIAPWFEWAPGARNIADVPTRNVDIPFVCRKKGQFANLREIFDTVEKATQALETSRPIVIPSTLGR